MTHNQFIIKMTIALATATDDDGNPLTETQRIIHAEWQAARLIGQGYEFDKPLPKEPPPPDNVTREYT